MRMRRSFVPVSLLFFADEVGKKQERQFFQETKVSTPLATNKAYLKRIAAYPATGVPCSVLCLRKGKTHARVY